MTASILPSAMSARDNNTRKLHNTDNNLNHHDSHSNYPGSPSASDSGSANNSKKRKDSGVDAAGNSKPVKRRAAKACAACRARKVRCDVMQRYHVTPEGDVTCSNCTMDGIKCVIEESKRRKKHLTSQTTLQARVTATKPIENLNGVAHVWNNGILSPPEGDEARRWSASTMSNNNSDLQYTGAHVSHPLYQEMHNKLSSGDELRRHGYMNTGFDEDPTYALLTSASITGDMTRTRVATPLPFSPPSQRPFKHTVPDYIKPLPPRMTSVDIDYLFAKGALGIPDTLVRNALLQSYLEWVHPYMPLIEVQELLHIIDEGNGSSGRISLLLFQAIMFAGTAFVDMEYLKAAGYTNRKSARKAFFQKARVLYDFDYELDRVSLVQSLLLMTYWYETPDDQKDTWHWMGVAISLAHTIGLHRNSENSNMEPSKKKLWKRIWWSCFMRDRLIALGMRRPTRVKDEDYDVPMLEEDDFEIKAVPLSNSIISRSCAVARDTTVQKKLAQMCIAKAKLCLCISHVLSAQYSVLVRHNQGLQDGTRSNVMLIPKKIDQKDEVRACDMEIKNWVNTLPPECVYSELVPEEESGQCLFVQRALLHMVYFTTLSALHRPQVLPSATPSTGMDSSRDLQDLSRKKVREASREITRISQNLNSRGLEKYLPTTGVTVLLPAIIIHLLDIKSCNDEARKAAVDGYSQCMLVLERLRDIYASADFATQFLEAAIRKASIDGVVGFPRQPVTVDPSAISTSIEGDGEKSGQEPFGGDEGVDIQTPPGMPDFSLSQSTTITSLSPALNLHADVQASTPLHPEMRSKPQSFSFEQSMAMNGMVEMDQNVDLNDFLNFDVGTGTGGGVLPEGWNVPFEEGAHGESGGWVGDMSWIDRQVGQWSRLNSPGLDGEGDEQMFLESKQSIEVVV